MQDPLFFTFSIAILIMSVVVHELAHGFTADFLGDPTARLAGRLTINPVKHLDPVGSFILPVLSFMSAGFIFGWAKPVPYNPYNLKGRYGEAMVAAAGPGVNFLIALAFGLVIRFFGEGFSASFLDIALVVVTINLILAIFNMIPIPPLDGSKVVFNLLPFRFEEWERKLEQYGFFVLIFFVFFGWQYISPVVSTLTHLITGLAP